MRRDVATAPSMRGVGVSETESPQRRIGRLLAGLRIDRLELTLLAAFGAVSVWVLALDLWQVLVNGRVWTGTDGMYVVDQLQYLSWIESASHHLLAGNLFVLHGTPADYFQPAVALSGILTSFGLAPTLVLLLWKPVAVVATFFAFRTYARRALPDAGRAPQLAVIALALFYGCFTDVFGHLGVIGDLFPGFMSWGYPFALLGLACMVFSVLAYERARAQGRIGWAAPLLGALAGSLHPWQGETLVLVLGAAELAAPDTRAAVRRGLGSLAAARSELRRAAASPRARLAAATIGMSLLPLLYYVALARFDLSWELGQKATKHGFPFIALGVALAPLTLVALLGYRHRERGFVNLATRLWPLASLFVYVQSSSSGGSAPQHSFFGVTLPLAVLAVGGLLAAGWRRLPRQRLVAVVLLLLATVPATWKELAGAKADVRPSTGNPNFIQADERRALDFLRRSPVPGGVFTRAYLGATVPGKTGRHTYAGNCIWSQPDCNGRADLARDLLGGELSPLRTRQILEATGARFVLSDCQDDHNLTRKLRPILAAVYRFGCATVWQLRG